MWSYASGEIWHCREWRQWHKPSVNVLKDGLSCGRCAISDALAFVTSVRFISRHKHLHVLFISIMLLLRTYRSECRGLRMCETRDMALSGYNVTEHQWTYWRTALYVEPWCQNPSTSLRNIDTFHISSQTSSYRLHLRDTFPLSFFFITGWAFLNEVNLQHLRTEIENNGRINAKTC